MRISRSFSAALFFGYKITKIKSFTHHKRLKKTKKGKEKRVQSNNIFGIINYLCTRKSKI